MRESMQHIPGQDYPCRSSAGAGWLCNPRKKVFHFARAKICASARCRTLRAQGIYPPSGVGATHRWLAGIFSARILHWYTCFRQTITIEGDHHHRHHHHQGSDKRDGCDDQSISLWPRNTLATRCSFHARDCEFSELRLAAQVVNEIVVCRIVTTKHDEFSRAFADSSICKHVDLCRLAVFEAWRDSRKQRIAILKMHPCCFCNPSLNV